MKIVNDYAIKYYFYGKELSSDNRPFPDWFETYYEKQACLLGYTDFDLNITRTEEQIIEKLTNGI